MQEETDPEIPCVEGDKAPGVGSREEGSFALLGPLAHRFS